nr:gamma carbonic anhydrase family protein [Ignavibacteria bacterium]
KYFLEIGNEVTFGHNAVVHGCRIKNNVLVGMGSVILDRAVVNSNSIVAAGALIKEGFEVPEGVLVAGVPAKIMRDLSADEIFKIKDSSNGYVGLAKEYLIKS